MIFIEEKFLDNETVEIVVDGMLDGQSLCILEEVCRRQLDSGMRLRLNLKGLVRVSREGKEFLRKAGERFQLLNMPRFLGLDRERP